MDPTLLGVIIGALAGILGSFFSGLVGLTTVLVRNHHRRDAARRSELIDAYSDMVQAIERHRVAWLFFAGDLSGDVASGDMPPRAAYQRRNLEGALKGIVRAYARADLLEADQATRKALRDLYLAARVPLIPRDLDPNEPIAKAGPRTGTHIKLEYAKTVDPPLEYLKHLVRQLHVEPTSRWRRAWRTMTA